MTNALDHPQKKDESISKVTQVLTELVSHIPSSSEAEASNPGERARSIIQNAALRAAGISGTLALPPGPLGMATILPDLAAIWHLQQQLVSDVASCYGKRAALTKEVMVYCLFRHGSALLLRDLVVRVGERMLIRRVALRGIQQILQRIGVRVTQKVIARTVSRYIPLIGALGIGGYSFYDTKKVGETAIDLFSKDIEFNSEAIPEEK